MKGVGETTSPGQAIADGTRHTGKSYGLICRQKLCDTHVVFKLVMAGQALYPVCILCHVFRISAAASMPSVDGYHHRLGIKPVTSTEMG
jgi:hypothetical protein